MSFVASPPRLDSMLERKWRILLLLPPPDDDDDDIDDIDDDGLLMFVTTPKRPFRRPLPDDEMGEEEEAPMAMTVVTARANAVAAAR